MIKMDQYLQWRIEDLKNELMSRGQYYIAHGSTIETKNVRFVVSKNIIVVDSENMVKIVQTPKEAIDLCIDEYLFII